MATYHDGKPIKPSVWQRFKSYFNSPAQGGVVFMDRSSSQVTRGSRELVDLYHQSPWLRATTGKIAQHCAAIPWKLYRANKRGNTRRFKTACEITTRKAMIKSALRSDNIIEVDAHPFLTLLEKSNPQLGGVGTRKVTQTYLDVVGECFWIIERNRDGLPIEIWPVPPTWIRTIPLNPGDSYEIAWGQDKRMIASRDMVWLKDHSLKNPYGRGIGIAHSLSDELDSDEYASQLIKTAFENRGLLDVVISVEGAKQEQLDRARAEFSNRHQGWLKAGTPFFHSGKSNVQVVSQSFSEMQLLQLREWERDTVISIYGVPPELLGVLGKSNRATITESREIMASEVLIPRAEYLRNVFNTMILPEYGDEWFCDFEDPTPSNDEFRLRAMQANPASVTVREWREVQGLVDRGERDDYVLIPAGLYPFRGSVGVDPTPPTNDSADNVDDASNNDDKAHASDVIVTKAGDRTHKIDLTHVINAVKPEAFHSLVPLWEQQLKATFEDDLAELQNDANKHVDGAPVTKAGAAFNELFAEHLRFFIGDRIKDLVDDTTKDRLFATLSEGLGEGESMPKLSKRVAEVFEVSKARARVIARTEVLRSSNFATYVALKESGVVTQREWISTLDDRTRDSHTTMHGARVDLSQPFTLSDGPNAGAQAHHPGGFDIAGEDIQCRCTTWGVVEDADKTMHTSMQSVRWKAFDSRLTSWENKALPLIEDAFATQERAVLEELESQHR